jgi:hypothetical protein
MEPQRPIFINCGSNVNYFDGANTWVSDSNYVGSGFPTYSTAATIANTAAQEIYKTERYDRSRPSSMKYSIALSPGYYDIYLHFAELYFEAEGAREFAVILENSVEIPALDVYREAKGFYRAYVWRKLGCPVMDGVLDIEFGRLVENPKINAIEIHPMTTPVFPTRTPPVTSTTTVPDTTTSTTTTAVVTTTTDTATTTSALSYGVDGFVLLDAIKDEDIAGGFNCTPACTGTATRFNIRAESFGTVGSVRLRLSGRLSTGWRVENVAPYTIRGDTPGTPPDYYEMALPSGDYTIEAEAFPLPGGEGRGSGIESLEFTMP